MVWHNLIPATGTQTPIDRIAGNGWPWRAAGSNDAAEPSWRGRAPPRTWTGSQRSQSAAWPTRSGRGSVRAADRRTSLCSATIRWPTTSGEASSRRWSQLPAGSERRRGSNQLPTWTARAASPTGAPVGSPPRPTARWWPSSSRSGCRGSRCSSRPRPATGRWRSSGVRNCSDQIGDTDPPGDWRPGPCRLARWLRRLSGRLNSSRSSSPGAREVLRDKHRPTPCWLRGFAKHPVPADAERAIQAASRRPSRLPYVSRPGPAGGHVSAADRQHFADEIATLRGSFANHDFFFLHFLTVTTGEYGKLRR